MYHKIANICRRTEAGESLKNILFSELAKENGKELPAIRALVDTTLRNKSTLDDLINSTQLAKELCFGDVWIARVLVAELVFGKRSYNCTDDISKKVYQYKEELRGLLGDAKKKERVFIPRYARINTTNCTKKQFHLGLSDEFNLREIGGKNEITYFEFLNIVKQLKKNEYILDYHIPNLYIFHPKAHLVNSKLYKENKIILQDKASCLVAPLLTPTPGSIMIDMCAAPGYKTQHLATLAGLSGHLFSIDINKDRYNVLNQTRIIYELSNVLTFNVDSLHLPEELTKYIEYILLDAPCSGSGVVQNYDYGSLDSYKSETKRLQSLHNLQAYLLRTALTNYPSARRIVYSTCSINEEENESVIDELIGVAAENEFVLVDLRNHLPDFTVGLEKYICGKYCIRLLPEESCTNGFFIALFERTNPPKAEKRQNFYSSFHEIINSIGKKKKRVSNNESVHEKNMENNLNEQINRVPEEITSSNEILNKLPLKRNNDINEELIAAKKPKLNNDNLGGDLLVIDSINENVPFSPSSNHSNNNAISPSKTNTLSKNKLDEKTKLNSAVSSEDSSSSSSDDSSDDNDCMVKQQDKTNSMVVEPEKNYLSDGNTRSVSRNSKDDEGAVTDYEELVQQNEMVYPDSRYVGEQEHSPNSAQNLHEKDQYSQSNNWQNNRNFNKKHINNDHGNFNGHFRGRIRKRGRGRGECRGGGRHGTNNWKKYLAGEPRGTKTRFSWDGGK